jgi:hypothetical protein
MPRPKVRLECGTTVASRRTDPATSPFSHYIFGGLATPGFRRIVDPKSPNLRMLRTVGRYSSCFVSRVTRMALVCVLAAFGVAIAGCGAGGPTQPSTTPRPTAFEIVNGNTGLFDFVLGPGDEVPVVGLTDTGPLRTMLPVASAQMTLESSNSSVLRIAGAHVMGVSPGEADIRATFQSFSASAHASVFPPSAVARLVLGGGGGQFSCSPNDRLEISVVAVLDDGTEIRKMQFTWRSSVPSVASVDVTGVINDASRLINCLSPGQTTLEVTYRGKTASAQVTVRAPQSTSREARTMAAVSGSES